MPLTPVPSHAVRTTLAGTASSDPVALWLRWLQVGGNTALAHWIAPAEQSTLNATELPAGRVFWLPTPAGAPSTERALEQSCRAALMPAVMRGTTQLRVLYGSAEEQLRALHDCLQAAIAEDIAANMDLGIDPPALDHPHSSGLRCRECVDPLSEQRLFSRLLQR